MALRFYQRPNSDAKDQVAEGTKGLYRLRYDKNRRLSAHVLTLNKIEIGRDKSRKRLLTFANEYDAAPIDKEQAAE